MRSGGGGDGGAGGGGGGGDPSCVHTFARGVPNVSGGSTRTERTCSLRMRVNVTAALYAAGYDRERER